MISGIITSVRKFLGVRFNLGLIICLLLLGGYLWFSQPQPNPQEVLQNASAYNISVHYFYQPTCPHCHEQRPIIDALKADYPNVYFAYHDVTRTDENMFFQLIAAQHGLDPSTLGTPTTIIVNKQIGNKTFAGVTTREAIEEYIQACINACAPKNDTDSNNKVDLKHFNLPLIGETDLTAYSLPMLAIVLGMIDGFNPCAMWVLVYLISVVAEIKDRSRIWLIVGSFLFASGTLYFLFMTAWLNAFLLLGYLRIVTLIIGLAGVGGGILAIKDYVDSRGQVVCKVGDAAQKKSTMKQINDLASAPLTWATIIGVVMLAFVINSIEFVCSSAIPAVFTQILALANISSLEHYGYILLYDIFYMIDDAIIFSMAAFAIAGGIGTGEKYASFSKVGGGVLLLLLGLLLLFAPNLLG